MIRKYIFTAIMAIIGIVAQAQKVFIFDSNSPGTKHHNHHKKIRGKNSVTIGTLAGFNGYLPVCYERKATSFLSIQIGAGPTFRSLGNDMGQIVYNDGVNSDYFNFISGYNDVTDHYENYKYRKTGSGYYLSVAPKFYFLDNCMDGFFLSPAISYKRFNYTARLADETVDQGQYFFTSEDDIVPRTDAKMHEHVNCLDFTIGIGGHFQAQNHFVFSWDIGWGVRSMSAQRLDLGYFYNGSSSYWQNHERSYSAIRPLMIFDIKLGGWF